MTTGMARPRASSGISTYDRQWMPTGAACRLQRMRKLLVVAGSALAMSCATLAQAQALSEAFNGLVGSCWRAELGDGVTDTHCFTMATGGKLVMDVHKVRSGSGVVVYEGVTTYRVEKDSGAIRYDYFNSMGDLLPGYGKREGDRLVFSATRGGAATTVWYLGPEAYEVGAADVTAAKRKFVKVGPAAADGL